MVGGGCAGRRTSAPCWDERAPDGRIRRGGAVLLAVGTASGAPRHLDSGIRGRVVYGRTCPVQRPGPKLRASLRRVDPDQTRGHRNAGHALALGGRRPVHGVPRSGSYLLVPRMDLPTRARTRRRPQSVARRSRPSRFATTAGFGRARTPPSPARETDSAPGSPSFEARRGSDSTSAGCTRSPSRPSCRTGRGRPTSSRPIVSLGIVVRPPVGGDRHVAECGAPFGSTE